MATQIFTVPSRAYAVGTFPFGPFVIAAGVTQIETAILRDPSLNLPGVEVIRVSAVCSFDGGVTWLATTSPSTELGTLDTHPAILFGMDGGPAPLGRDGLPVTSTIDRTAITSPCQVKGLAVVSQPLTTTITVTLT